MNDCPPDGVIELMRAANGHRFDDPGEAHRLYAEALIRSRQNGWQRELIRALKGLGQIERDQGHADEALELYEEAVTICRVEGDALLLAHTVRHVGDIHQDAGRLHRAEPAYQEALTIYRSHPSTALLDLANTIRALAELKEKAGEVEDAVRLWTEARQLYEAVNVSQGVAEAAHRLARHQTT